MSVVKAKSINLYPTSGSKTDSEDGSEDDEGMLQANKDLASQQNVWSEGGTMKNKLVARVIKLGSKFVSSNVVNDDVANGRNYLITKYEPNPDASQSAYDLKK